MPKTIREITVEDVDLILDNFLNADESSPTNGTF